METRRPEPADFAALPDGGLGAQVGLFNPPPGSPDNIHPAAVIVAKTESGVNIRVPWQPDEIDVAMLANGGTVWLVVNGNELPAHRVEVLPRAEVVEVVVDGADGDEFDDG